MSNKSQVKDKELETVTGGTSRAEFASTLDRADALARSGAGQGQIFGMINDDLQGTDYDPGGEPENVGKHVTYSKPRGGK